MDKDRKTVVKISSGLLIIGVCVLAYFLPMFPGATPGHYLALGMGSFLALIGAYVLIAGLFGKVKVIR